MTKNDSKQATSGKVWAQELSLYHPNNTGTGAALALEPRVNRRPDDRFNCFFMTMAAQKTVAADDRIKTPATFNWENKLTVKLGFADICEILAVLEGKSEKVGGARNGLYHDNGQASAVITFQRNTERGGYFVGLSRKDKNGGQLTRVSMALSEAEALGLRHIFQAGLFFVTFHTHLFGGMSSDRDLGVPGRAAGGGESE